MEPSEETKSPKSADNVPVSRGSEAVALNCESLKRLTEKGFEDVARKLQDNGVTDNVLGKVTEAQLKELGISPLGWRLKAVDCIQKITGRTLDYKILNDPIHGHIVIHPLCVKIMDTPQFQRLRYIKQLGGAYFVYPGACHNRFEHSLGVCYLAGQLVTSLRDRQPELEISDTDILCVEIAGLCHDLGHGPFSHLFDNYFLKEIGKGDIKHEDLSQEMFDFLVNDNKLSSEFEKYGVTETDKSFIRELIKGRKDYKKKWEYKGRPKEKGFLYDIVANKTNEIDVDKWDYFARDCHMLGINNTFDHTRCMKFARVLKVDETGDDETGDRQICFRDKEVGDFYDMFYTRSTLHRRAYQHVVTKSVERMISEALVKANEILEVPGTGLIIAETVSDMKAYMKLTDSIFEQILWSTDEKLVQSREILMNIHKRKLYKCVGKTSPEKDFNIEKFEERVIKREVSEILKKNGSPLKSEDIVINTVSLDYGKKEENPVDYIFFYNNPNPNTPLKIRKDEVSKMLPENFAEKWIVCYCKKLETDRIEEAKKAFNEWCKQNKLSWSNESMLGGMTPVKPLPSNEKPTPGKAVKGLHFTE